MRRLYTILATLALCTSASLSAADLPAGWFLAGSRPQDYTVTIDESQPRAGERSALLASKSGKASGFGTLMQQVQAGQYKGKRLMFTAHVRAEDVKDWAGLWMRVDGSGNAPLAFDNMHDRPIKGSSPWSAHSIVLDVPVDATDIAFGILLHGPGKVWIDTASFQTVDTTVPVTGGQGGSSLPAAPVNLDFEE